MFRVENLNTPKIPQISKFIKSGPTVEDSEDGTGFYSTYFFPSMVFPVPVEILSLTFLYKNSKTDKKIHIVVQNDPTKKPEIIPEETNTLVHPKDNLVSFLRFPKPILIGQLKPFFCVNLQESLQDSNLIIEFREC